MRYTKMLTGLASFIALSTSVLAGPAAIVGRETSEDEWASDERQSVADLLGEGDRLASQQEFNQAVRMFEKAYRLAPSNRDVYVRLLVAKRAAGTMTQQEREALKLIQDQESAEIDLAFRAARLSILKARGAIQNHDFTLAKRIADEALEELALLPMDVDAAIYSRQLKTIQTTAAKKLNKAAKQQNEEKKAAVAKQRKKSPEVIDETTDASLDVVPPAPLSDDERTARYLPSRVRPDPHDVFEETGEIIPTDQQDFCYHAYDRAVSASLKRSRLNWLLSNNEVATVPPADMTYPSDWEDKTAHRGRYRDGVIFESQPFTGADGKSYTTAIYELGDLVHPVPNFYADYPGTARRQRMEDMDRFYLQQRSQIFNGYAEDLAAGLPLLHFFGGIDNNAVSTRTDGRETERVMQILQRFLDSQPQ